MGNFGSISYQSAEQLANSDAMSATNAADEMSLRVQVHDKMNTRIDKVTSELGERFKALQTQYMLRILGDTIDGQAIKEAVNDVLSQIGERLKDARLTTTLNGNEEAGGKLEVRIDDENVKGAQILLKEAVRLMEILDELVAIHSNTVSELHDLAAAINDEEEGNSGGIINAAASCEGMDDGADISAILLQNLHSLFGDESGEGIKLEQLRAAAREKSEKLAELRNCMDVARERVDSLELVLSSFFEETSEGIGLSEIVQKAQEMLSMLEELDLGYLSKVDVPDLDAEIFSLELDVQRVHERIQRDGFSGMQLQQSTRRGNGADLVGRLVEKIPTMKVEPSRANRLRTTSARLMALGAAVIGLISLVADRIEPSDSGEKVASIALARFPEAPLSKKVIDGVRDKIIEGAEIGAVAKILSDMPGSGAAEVFASELLVKDALCIIVNPVGIPKKDSLMVNFENYKYELIDLFLVADGKRFKVSSKGEKPLILPAALFNKACEGGSPTCLVFEGTYECEGGSIDVVFGVDINKLKGIVNTEAVKVGTKIDPATHGEIAKADLERQAALDMAKLVFYRGIVPVEGEGGRYVSSSGETIEYLIESVTKLGFTAVVFGHKNEGRVSVQFE